MNVNRGDRRTVLGWAGAAGLVGMTGLADAQNRAFAPIQRADSGPFCPRTFGAIGDGQFRPLADRYPTLAAAQAVHPFVTSLRQSLDWAGIQSALNAAEPVSGRVVIPVGRFVISDTLRLPNQITFEGESRWGSIIDNQNLPLAAPQLANKSSSFLYVTIRNLTLHGGTHALKVHVEHEVAGCVIDGVTAQLQSEANVEFNSLQTTVFRDCHFIHGRHGISVTDFPCNSVHLFNCRLGSHSDATLRLRGADLVIMVGGSMEAGGGVGPATIDLDPGGAYANAISFIGVYFENTHRVLLRSRGAQPIKFVDCKFTGTGAGRNGFGPFEFDCGDDLIEFGTNFWFQPTIGPAQMMLTGRNDWLAPGGAVWHMRGRGVTSVTSRDGRPASPLLAIGRLEGGGVGEWAAAQIEAIAIGRDTAGKRTMRTARFDLLADLDPAAGPGWLVVTPSAGDALLHLLTASHGTVVELGVAVAGSSGFTAERVRLTLTECGGSVSGAGLDVRAR